MNAVALMLACCLSAEPLAAGDHVRSLTVGGRERTYRVHVPPQYDHARPTPVVLVYHGAITNGAIMVWFTGMNAKADREGFVTVYPDGTGRGSVALVWNSGGIPPIAEGVLPDDVAFTRALLDDLATAVHVDRRRTFATGISNGGMMCHRLAVELSDRIAAVAPVSGTLSLPDAEPTRPISVLHIHGTEDGLVSWKGNGRGKVPVTFLGVEETIRFWVRHDGCAPEPKVEPLPDAADDGTKCTRYTYAGGKQGTEVVLVKIEGGGHTWPGHHFRLKILGRTTRDFDANDLIWDFFRRHPMPE